MARIDPNRSLLFGALAALALLALGQSAHAGTLNGLSLSHTSAPVGTMVTATVSMSGTKCGYRVDWGDGTVIGPFGINPGTGQRSRAYPAAGTYTVRVFGGAVPNGPSACAGSQTAPVTITDGGGSGNGMILQRAPVGPRVLRPKTPKKPGKPGPSSTPTPPPGTHDARMPNLPELKLPDCSTLACVENVVVTAEGTRANFTVYTSNEAKLLIRVHPNEPMYNQMPAWHGQAVTAQWKTKTKTHIVDLEAGRQYWYLVKSRNRDGHIRWSKGTFTTQKRRATITLKHIHINHDGDPGIDAGEMIHRAEIDGSEFWHMKDPNLNSGDDVAMNFEWTLKDPPLNPQLRLGTFENDTVYNIFTMFTGDSDYTWITETLHFDYGAEHHRSYQKRITDGEFDVMFHFDVRVWFEN